MTPRKWFSVVSLLSGVVVAAIVLLTPDFDSRAAYALGLAWGYLATVHVRWLSE